MIRFVIACLLICLAGVAIRWLSVNDRDYEPGELAEHLAACPTCAAQAPCDDLAKIVKNIADVRRSGH